MNKELRDLSIPEGFKEWDLLDLFIKSCNGYLTLVEFKDYNKFMLCYDFDWYYFACQWFERLGYERE